MKIMVYRNRVKIKGDISVKSVLRIVRSGFEILSQMKLVSAYGSMSLAGGVLGVVGLVIALRDGRIGNLSNLLLVTDRDSSSERLRFVPGLRNLGNNCFLNVVLQSLASCSSFRRYIDEVVELQLLSNEEQVEELPLLSSLDVLLEELSTLKDRSRSLNPRKVMSAIEDYIPQFRLTNEQDAEEALLHLLSCLREELSESCMPSCGSLIDVDAPTSRIFAFKGLSNVNELRTWRWRKQYIGPFDGVLGSFLTCRSCSFEIMMDFGFFHSLPLSLMVNTGAPLGRFTVADCMKRFLSPEHLENYFCSHCWHIAAVKYLTSTNGIQEDICKLSCCSEQDGCDCKKLSSLQALPWSNRFSHTYKQLYIAHFPQILCLHLQRTSMNTYGELVKIEGHISFPLILDLSQFAKYEFGIQKQNLMKPKTLEQHYPFSISNPRIIDLCSDPMKVKERASETSPKRCSPLSGTCLESICMPTKTDKVGYDSVPSKTHLYRLVSVAEHFGRAGSGHYTVYRGVRAQIEEGDVGGQNNTLPMQWFRISDSVVHHASEEDVLGAHACLLFYERI